MILEDRHLTPADVAAFRIDFTEFLEFALAAESKIGARFGQRPCDQLGRPEVSPLGRANFPTPAGTV